MLIVARHISVGPAHDHMVKSATAIRVGTASTEAILHRFIQADGKEQQ